MAEGAGRYYAATHGIEIVALRFSTIFGPGQVSFREAVRLLELGTGPYARRHTRSFALDDAEAAIARLEGTDGEPPALHVSIERGIDS